MTRDQILVVLGIIGCAVCAGCMFSALAAGLAREPGLLAGTVAGAGVAVAAAWLAEKP